MFKLSVLLLASALSAAPTLASKSGRQAPVEGPGDPNEYRDNDGNDRDDDLEACYRSAPSSVNSTWSSLDDVLFHLLLEDPAVAVCSACVGGSYVSVYGDYEFDYDYDYDYGIAWNGVIGRQCVDGPDALVVWDPVY